MVKKNLKRGLALGALMAFVITGNAMAVDVTYSGSTDPVGNGDNLIIADGNGIYANKIAKDFTGWNDVKITGNWNDWSSVIEADTYIDYKDNISIGTIKITGINSLTTEDGIEIAGQIINADGADISITVVNDVILKTSTSSDPEYFDNGVIYGDRANLSIVAKNITLDTPNRGAILAQSGTHYTEASAGMVYLQADSINIKGSGNNEGNAVIATLVGCGSEDEPLTPPAVVKLEGKEVNVEATQGEKIAILTHGGTVEIGQNEGFEKANIIGNIRSSYNEQGLLYQMYYEYYQEEIAAATPEEKDRLQAELNAIINDAKENSAELLAADGKVNINLGEGGSFTGAFIQDKPLPGLENLNIATTTLRLGNGSVWNLTKASTLTEATFGAGSSLVIDGTKFTGENADYAITGKVSMEPTANLIINNSAPDTNYKVVKGENNISDSNLSYDRTALVAVEKTDNVYEVEFKSIANANESELSAAQDKAVAANGGSNLVAPGIISGSISSSASSETKALGRAIMQMAGTAEQKAAILNDIAQIGEKAGNTTNAVNIINNVTGITNQRMSFTNINTAPQGGHGKVERKYKSGAGVWAQYMHGKDKVEDLPGAGSTTSSYESQYNGAVIGYDFKEVGKTKTGISFNYGEGDSHSKDAAVKTNNDFDFWGVGLYHSIMNEDTNLIFDINYNKTDADVTQVVPGYGNITVNPNTTAISAGVRAEKLIQNGPVQIVPYVGARFLSIDTDEYTSSAGIKYSPDRQNIWLVPVGVSLRQENNYENGWKVTPKADLSYIWALGDTDSSMNVATGVKVDNLAYTVMDNGSFLGTVGIEASKGDWTYGLSYSYQKGEYQRSDKWFVDVRYSF